MTGLSTGMHTNFGVIFILNFCDSNAKLILLIRNFKVILGLSQLVFLTVNFATFLVIILFSPDSLLVTWQPTHWRIPWKWSARRMPLSKKTSADLKSSMSPFCRILSHRKCRSMVFFLPPWSYIHFKKRCRFVQRWWILAARICSVNFCSGGDVSVHPHLIPHSRLLVVQRKEHSVLRRPLFLGHTFANEVCRVVIKEW